MFRKPCELLNIVYIYIQNLKMTKLSIFIFCPLNLTYIPNLHNRFALVTNTKHFQFLEMQRNKNKTVMKISHGNQVPNERSLKTCKIFQNSMFEVSLWADVGESTVLVALASYYICTL